MFTQTIISRDIFHLPLFICTDENDAKPLPVVDVKVEAMTADAIDDECYIVDNRGNMNP